MKIVILKILHILNDMSINVKKNQLIFITLFVIKISLDHM